MRSTCQIIFAFGLLQFASALPTFPFSHPDQSLVSQCSSASYEYCCNEGTPCDCARPSSASGQCSSYSYGYCCEVGAPCDCSQTPLFTAAFGGVATKSNGVGAVIDCMNGNVCANPQQTCVGSRSDNRESVVGRKWGCANLPSLCPGRRSSCPMGTTCNATATAMSCIALDNATVVSLPVRNNNSLVSKNATVADGFCAIIADYLPSDCTCTDARVGGTVDCSADVVVDDIGVRAEFRPCDSPAYISLTVYETKIGFSYNVGKVAAGQSIDEPIPGLDVGIPVIGDAGVYADASVGGNLDSLTVSLGINLCGEIFGQKVCGSDLYSGLPVQLLSGTWDFSSLCTGHPRV